MEMGEMDDMEGMDDEEDEDEEDLMWDFLREKTNNLIILKLNIHKIQLI